MPVTRCHLVAVLIATAIPGAARANPALVATDRFPYTKGADVVVDGGVAVGAPSALPTGLARGVFAGVAYGRVLALGVRAAWMTATESTLAWRVTHSDLRLHSTTTLQRPVGRGLLGLRLGIGGNLIHESRVRNQGARAGLMGDELSTSATAILPAGELEAVLSLHIAGPWLVTVSGGPSLAVDGGDVLTGWNGQLGVAWQP
jgi:hypothetical protein